MLLKEYRSKIREVWLPIVGRLKLTSFEYELIGRWHGEGIPVYTVLTAIRDCAARGSTLHSIGVIRSDLARLGRQKARSGVGAHVETDNQWREKYAEDLEECASMAADPEVAAMYRELAGQLLKLTKSEANERFKEISKHI